MGKKHGYSLQNDKPRPEYSAWQSAKARCHSKTHDNFKNYGGRGITMCEKWRNDFSAFLAYMGERPAGTTLGRIDNNGNYEPGNVRWEDWFQQNRNRRCRKFSREIHLEWRRLRQEGWKFREIAEAYGCPTGTVSTQLISLKKQGL